MAFIAAVVAVASCGGAESVDTTVPPQPATPVEMEAFCAAYEQVRSKSFGEMTAELAEVSPAEIKTQMVRASNFPAEGGQELRTAVETFLKRCDAP